MRRIRINLITFTPARCAAGQGAFRRAVLGGALLSIVLAPAVSAQVFLPFRFRVVDEISLEVGEDVGTEPMTLADVNHDGRLDLVAILQDEDQVAVLLGEGGGQFEEPGVFDLDIFPTAVAVADVSSDTADGSAAPDGNPDIILASDDGFPVLLLGDGEGGFSGADAQDLEELVDGLALVGVAVADFDENGLPDLAFADEGEVVYFLCNEDGTFAPCTTDIAETGGEGPVDSAPGDFDGDGHQDLAVLNVDSANLSVFYGDGDGEFDPARLFAATVVQTNEPSALAASPLDANDTDDIVIVNREEFDSLGVLVLLGLGRNRFESQAYTVPFDATGVAVATLDGDGEPDIAISSDPSDSFTGPTLLAGVGGGTFDQNLFAAPGAERLSRGIAILTGDVGGDALPDLVQLHADGDRVGVAINISNEPRPSATPTFTSPPAPTVTPTVTATRPPHSDEDDGCAVVAPQGDASMELFGMLTILALLARRRSS